MSWKSQICGVLRKYPDENLCVRCVHELLPTFSLRQVDELLRSMVGNKADYVGKYEAACSRCGEVREVFGLI